MADLEQYKVYKNKNFEVLTEDGFKDFKGIIVGENINKIKIQFNNGNTLICTPKHKLVISKTKWIFAKDLKENDIIYGNIKIFKIKKLKNNKRVYDFLHVEGTNSYFANKILSKNCIILDEFAFVRPEIAHKFYEAVYPTISSSRTAKVIMLSTPNGTNGKFYEMFSKAELGENHKEWNGWKASKVMWDEIPRYNSKGELDFDGFKNEAIAGLNGDMNSWLQEFCCVFHDSGAAAINATLLEKLKSKIREPIYRLDDGDYLVWEDPIAGHIYTIGVDVSEGVGLDSSVAQILDITDLTDIRLVGQYHSNSVQPYVYAEKLNKIARGWGNPFLAIERNGPGGQVIDALYEVHKYNNIIHYSMKNDARGMYQKMGIFSHTNSKYTGIMNMKYWVEALGAVDIPDIATIKEYETYRRKDNGTWCAQMGHFDDRVMAMVWALIPLETEIAQRYFHILQYDDVGKPKIIKDNAAAFSDYMGPLWDSDSLEQASLGDPAFSCFGVNPLDLQSTPRQKDMLDMGVAGWTIL